MKNESNEIKYNDIELLFSEIKSTKHKEKKYGNVCREDYERRKTPVRRTADKDRSPIEGQGKRKDETQRKETDEFPGMETGNRICLRCVNSLCLVIMFFLSYLFIDTKELVYAATFIADLLLYEVTRTAILEDIFYEESRKKS